jgi:hypothetical protein
MPFVSFFEGLLLNIIKFESFLFFLKLWILN